MSEVRIGANTTISTRTGDRTWTNGGQTFRPDQSKVIGVGESKSGKSVEIYHNDGTAEVINKATGRDTFRRTDGDRHTPAADPYRPAPPSVGGYRPTPPNPYRNDFRPTPPNPYQNPYQHEYRPTPPSPSYYRPSRPSTHVDINLGGIRIDVHNSYLRQDFYIAAPVFTSGLWTPPVYTPVIYAPEIPVMPIGDLYRNDNSVSSVREFAGAEDIANGLWYAGVHTDRQLLDAARTPEQRRELAMSIGIDGYELRQAAGQADLMRVDGIGPRNSRLLVDAGIRSVQDLARYTWDTGTLVSALQSRAYATGASVPSAYEIQSWISQARALPVALYDDAYNASL